MVQETVFRDVIIFFDKLGVYDVLLPFLLVFSIVFAILEKTKVLGVEKVEGTEYTKKNLNAIVAFVVSFLVVASTKLVSAINQAVANVVLILILLISFLMLVGVFFGSEEFTLKNYPGWTKFFMVVVFIGIVLVFMEALGWLTGLINFVSVNYQTDWVASLILLVVVIAFIIYITKGESPKKQEKEESE